MFNFLRSSIRTKIILPYVLLTLIVGLGGTFIVTRLVSDTVEERLENQLLGSGTTVNNAVIDQEETRLTILRHLIVCLIQFLFSRL